jgi:hypothetical protein
MSPTSPNKPSIPSPTTGRFKRLFSSTLATTLLVILAIAALIVVYSYFSDQYDRAMYRQVYGAVEQIRHDIMDPAGALEIHANGFPDVRGNGTLEIYKCLPDVKCPIVDRKWFVPVLPGQEEQFVRTIMQREGYRITLKNLSECTSLEVGRSCDLDGNNGNLSISTGLTVADPAKAPARDVSPKVWRVVGVGMGLK